MENNFNEDKQTTGLTVRVPLSYKSKLLDEAQSLGITMSELILRILYKADKKTANEVANMPKKTVKKQEDPILNKFIEDKKIINERNTIIYSKLLLFLGFLIVNAAIFTLFYFDVIEKSVTQTLFIFFLVFFAVNFIKNPFAKDKTE